MTEKSKHTDTQRHQNTERQQDKEQGTMGLQNSQKTMNKMATASPYLSIITLNKNRLNSPIKIKRMAEWIKTQDPTTCCCLQETCFSL